MECNNHAFEIAVIIANTYENPINLMIAGEANTPIANGIILFDLTLIYGVKARQRYVSAEIKNSQLLFNSIETIGYEIEQDIKNACLEHFRNNLEIVSNSIISHTDKYILVHS